MSHTAQLTPDQALAKLQAGNHRFRAGIKSVDFMAGNRRLRELAEQGQKPFAIVLTCSDSRMPAEHLFDCGPGALFVIRVAGNVLTPEVIGSIEFAATSFDTPICLIMGHTRCGAISAAVSSELNGNPAPTRSLGAILDRIRPAVRNILDQPGAHRDEALQRRITIENVLLSTGALLNESEALQNLAKEGRFRVASALCDLSTGEIEFLGLTPSTGELEPPPVRAEANPDDTVIA
jgi:carbonic anhydrase